MKKSEESQNLKVQSGAPFDDEHAPKLFETRHRHRSFSFVECVHSNIHASIDTSQSLNAYVVK